MRKTDLLIPITIPLGFAIGWGLGTLISWLQNLDDDIWSG